MGQGLGPKVRHGLAAGVAQRSERGLLVPAPATQGGVGHRGQAGTRHMEGREVRLLTWCDTSNGSHLHTRVSTCLKSSHTLALHLHPHHHLTHLLCHSSHRPGSGAHAPPPWRAVILGVDVACGRLVETEPSGQQRPGTSSALPRSTSRRAPEPTDNPSQAPGLRLLEWLRRNTALLVIPPRNSTRGARAWRMWSAPPYLRGSGYCHGQPPTVPTVGPPHCSGDEGRALHSPPRAGTSNSPAGLPVPWRAVSTGALCSPPLRPSDGPHTNWWQESMGAASGRARHEHRVTGVSESSSCTTCDHSEPQGHLA